METLININLIRESKANNTEGVFYIEEYGRAYNNSKYKKTTLMVVFLLILLAILFHLLLF